MYKILVLFHFVNVCRVFECACNILHSITITNQLTPINFDDSLKRFYIFYINILYLINYYNCVRVKRYIFISVSICKALISLLRNTGGKWLKIIKCFIMRDSKIINKTVDSLYRAYLSKIECFIVDIIFCIKLFIHL